ncbi:Class I glutamine amidotransferase-like protein [Glarea lozoyensis ATCC 20868]|uniref:Class I glutamine amidotransferase-like protein n=2 Tax=Glarea lozoyensis TaxID=101852 RepID=S3CY80_GLAL2|nr:Class I glutamine amidotransferase-like protein [Glarea lozoyensis ATCC 20868]EPE29909.1 Class I glutamine amidotransferase-like protein [Glarea lozoyensis ATCC 20868]
MRISSVLLGAALASNVLSETSPLGLRLGMLLYPGYQALDAWGPLDFLNILSFRTQLNLTIISPDGLPVPIRTSNPAFTRSNSTVDEVVLATHSFANAPPLDVLFVPGGVGNRDVAAIQSSIDFVRATYPSLQYLITVCTGAGIAARAGVLDGRNATTNKRAFYEMANHGPRTWWHSKARWVVDGNVWSSSGVSAGMDVTLAWIQHVWGATTAEDLAVGAEYDWHRDPSWDPFFGHYNISDVVNGVTMAPSAPTPTPTPNIAKPRPFVR